ncbi:hypothetical protein F0231_08230 [Vibrio sp. RE86]|uniref:DUF3592 domain-containing protein n=1 Tax=Vibrio sp. RE86 TaxID=2607605 RepID=UPI0014939813|nr:DUF3592 domain-containing protein [Vibrio sp. RE86]NOH79730.1 hypothetical protein [Vibrio sp. RE86]
MDVEFSASKKVKKVIFLPALLLFLWALVPKIYQSFTAEWITVETQITKLYWQEDPFEGDADLMIDVVYQANGNRYGATIEADKVIDQDNPHDPRIQVGQTVSFLYDDAVPSDLKVTWTEGSKNGWTIIPAERLQ